MGRANDCRLYVGRLSHRTRERDLDRLFAPFGKIREILLKAGFAFVEFDDPRDAEDACYELNGRDLLGDRILVEMAKGTERGRGGLPMRGDTSSRDRSWMDKYGPFKRTDYRVIVENLSTRVSWQDLKDLMRKVGCEVCYADAHHYRKNEAVVEFASRSDMKRAIEKYDGHEINGRRMALREDRRTESLSRSRSRSHQRKGSASRRRSVSRGRNRKSRSRSKGSPRKTRQSRSPDIKRRRTTKSRSRSRSKSSSKPRSQKNEGGRSNGQARDSSKEHSRSCSPNDPKAAEAHGHDRSPARKTKDSRDRSVSRSRSRSRSKSQSRSRSRSRDVSGNQSPSKNRPKERSQSKERSRSRGRSSSRENSAPRSRSGSRERTMSRERSGSRTRSDESRARNGD